MGKEEMNTEKTKDKLSEAWDKTLQITDAPKKSVNGSGEVDALHTNGAKASRPAQVVPTEEAPAPAVGTEPLGGPPTPKAADVETDTSGTAEESASSAAPVDTEEKGTRDATGSDPADAKVRYVSNVACCWNGAWPLPVPASVHGILLHASSSVFVRTGARRR